MGARKDGGRQGEMAAGKERWRLARRDDGGQGETVAGKERRRQARMLDLASGPLKTKDNVCITFG